MNREKYIYATLLSTPNYLLGVKVLYDSLRKYGKTTYPFVCFCSKRLPESSVDELEQYGIECVCLQSEALSLDLLSRVEKNPTYKHWMYTFDKLLLFGMEQYEKIIFLDTDMIVLDNIDELFDKPSMSAVVAGQFKIPEWVRLNSGLMVFCPNKNVEHDLLNAILPTINELTALGTNVGDQDVINFYYKNWPNEDELHLSEDYNVFFNWLPEYVKYANHLPKVVHFIGRNKPWMSRTLYRELRYLAKLFFHQRVCIGTYLKYRALLYKIRLKNFLR